jgi:hypothetical protein
MTQVRIPRDFPVVVLGHLTSIAATPSDRRDALAVLSLVTSSLAPRSYVSTKPPDALAVQLGMGSGEISRSIKLLLAARAINLVRRDRRLLIAVTPAAAGSRATGPDLVVRRRLDDAVEEIFNRACASNNLDEAADLLAVLEKWNSSRKDHSRRRRSNERDIKTMRAELERRTALRAGEDFASGNGSDRHQVEGRSFELPPGLELII